MCWQRALHSKRITCCPIGLMRAFPKAVRTASEQGFLVFVSTADMYNAKAGLQSIEALKFCCCEMKHSRSACIHLGSVFHLSNNLSDTTAFLFRQAFVMA